MVKHSEARRLGQGSAEQAEVLSQLCYVFVRPVLHRLYQHMDRRLVQTLLDLLQVMVTHRHRQHGLVLSELGGCYWGRGGRRLAPSGSTGC